MIVTAMVKDHARDDTDGVPVEARGLPPLEIGLMVLASLGKIDFVGPPPGFVECVVPGAVKREAVEDEKPGGVVWLNKRSGGQKAIFPLTIILREAIELPAGLTRERGVRLIVPDGVPKPRGAKQERVYMDVK